MPSPLQASKHAFAHLPCAPWLQIKSVSYLHLLQSVQSHVTKSSAALILKTSATVALYIDSNQDCTWHPNPHWQGTQVLDLFLARVQFRPSVAHSFSLCNNDARNQPTFHAYTYHSYCSYLNYIVTSTTAGVVRFQILCFKESLLTLNSLPTGQGNSSRLFRNSYTANQQNVNLCP